MSKPRKPPELGGRPRKPTELGSILAGMSGRPRKPAELRTGRPVGRPRKPLDLSTPVNAYPQWKPHKLPVEEDVYWRTALRLMRVAKSSSIADEAAAFQVKAEQHLSNRPEGYGDFPPWVLREFPEWTNHPTRLTRNDLKNKKSNGYLRPLPQDEESKQFQSRMILIHHLWLAGQVNGWLNKVQLMEYLKLENYNTFRGQLNWAFACYNTESRRVHIKHDKKAVFYRIRTVPIERWLGPAPRHAAVEGLSSVHKDCAVSDTYPKGFVRGFKFVLEVDSEGTPLPVRLVLLKEIPAVPVEDQVNIQEVGDIWQSGYPGKKRL